MYTYLPLPNFEITLRSIMLCPKNVGILWIATDAAFRVSNGLKSLILKSIPNFHWIVCRDHWHMSDGQSLVGSIQPAGKTTQNRKRHRVAQLCNYWWLLRESSTKLTSISHEWSTLATVRKNIPFQVVIYRKNGMIPSIIPTRNKTPFFLRLHDC